VYVRSVGIGNRRDIARGSSIHRTLLLQIVSGMGFIGDQPCSGR